MDKVYVWIIAGLCVTFLIYSLAKKKICFSRKEYFFIGVAILLSMIATTYPWKREVHHGVVIEALGSKEWIRTQKLVISVMEKNLSINDPNYERDKLEIQRLKQELKLYGEVGSENWIKTRKMMIELMEKELSQLPKDHPNYQRNKLKIEELRKELEEYTSKK